MKPSSQTPVDTIDLSEAANQIRPSDPLLADLLEAIDAVDADAMHTMAEYPDSEPECVDDCPPCVAKYSAQIVASQRLRQLAKETAR
ncbi:hypothetical protein [Streptomyces iakyrus]|uniref:hypothetical protein n=1 Tax=Streptomyces iakyrus TaxID=68219 RepID=UPI0036792412